ncbi:uncharacterized protein L201_002404 [Kwoniella dendrophila CBS 6074]|uniref:CUE domain-containing protein n=1 Tax=Kwoniella dendrophila CBS 6074 TaxID=1295534 RepID=A0AAX4JRL0_9TREE
MEDIIPTIIIIAAIYFLIRWFTGSKTGNSADGNIRGVTPAMVDTIHSAFPDIPIPNIIYSLSRTKSAQITSEIILERGILPAPPPNFSIPAALLPVSSTTSSSSPSTPTINTNNANNAKSSTNSKNTSLIDRYNLTSRIPSSHKGKEKEIDSASSISIDSDKSSTSPISEVVVPRTEEKGKWEDSREKRESGLKERKEKMILEARRRMLEKQNKVTA